MTTKESEILKILEKTVHSIGMIIGLPIKIEIGNVDLSNIEQGGIVINEICDLLNISKLALESTNGYRALVDARKITSHILYSYFNLNNSEIGSLINRDHSSVVYYRKEYHELFETDPKFKKKAKLILSSLRKSNPLIFKKKRL